MFFSLCVVTTFCIPTAKHLIEGRHVLGMRSMRVSSESLRAFFIWTTPCESLKEFEMLLSFMMHLEKTSPVSWSKNRSTPSIPPTTNVDLSPCMWFIEYKTFGLTRTFHKVLVVLQITEQGHVPFSCSFANKEHIIAYRKTRYNGVWN